MTSSNENGRHFTSPGDIFGVFRSLQHDRSSINVQFEEASQLYSSLVLDANLPERFVLLDEISPEAGRDRIESGMPFSFRGSINGIRVYAEGMRVTRVFRDPSGTYYQASFPTTLLYLQRRDAFRARVPGSLTASVSLRSEDREKPPQGRLLDLSPTGARIAFRGRFDPELEIMEEFQAEIELSSQEQFIPVRLEVRNREYDRERDQTVAGFRFLDLNRTAMLDINRLVTQLQREGMA